MTYVTARAVTNGQGYQLRGDIDIHGLKTIDVHGVAENVWKKPSTQWIYSTLQEIRDLNKTWTHKYDGLVFYLIRKYSEDTPCLIGRRGGASIIINDVEYRMRNHIVHDRKTTKQIGVQHAER